MTDPRPLVKPAAALQPTAAAGATSPGAYTRWRATALGRVTLAREQRRILELAGSVDGKRVLEIGVGSGLNFPLYTNAVTHVIGLDTSPQLLSMGFRIEQIETGYMKGPKPMTFMYEGKARPV